MFEGLKARMERFFSENTPPADRRAQAGALRSAIIEARVAVTTMRDALTASERQLEIERRQAEDAERRGKLAGDIGDHETVAVAERFAARHRERFAVVERRIAVQQDEAAHGGAGAGRDDGPVAQCPGRCRRGQRARCLAGTRDGGGTRPETDLNDSLLQAEIDQARRQAAVDEQLAFLKKKMGKQ